VRKFLYRILLFGVIFIANALFIFLIDPYNIFFNSNFIEDEIKIININRSDEAMPRANALWKLNEYSKTPKSNIIIGDSRSRHIDVNIIKNLTGEEYYNFGVPGGNYNLIRDIFWLADSKTDLKNVFIQVGFLNYNKFRNYDVYKLVMPYTKNPFRMFFKAWFSFDSFYALLYKIFPEYRNEVITSEEDNQKMNISRWNEVLDKQGYSVLKKYAYPNNYYTELLKIAEYCRQKDINLRFLVFPNHPDFFKIVSELNLEDERERFKADIHGLANTFDFNFDNAITNNKDLFIDLYHTKQCIIDSITNDIWGIKNPGIIMSKYSLESASEGL